MSGSGYYDRLRKRNKYFEIPTFLPIEGRKSKADKMYAKIKVYIFLVFTQKICANFPVLIFSHE